MYIYIYMTEKSLFSIFMELFVLDSSPAPKSNLAGHDFVFVGPLLDKAGATRAAGHKFHGEHTPNFMPPKATDVLSLAKAAKLAGRQVGFLFSFFSAKKRVLCVFFFHSSFWS